MSDSKLNSLQINLLTMMSWFHNFCVNNGIRYYMIGGTMLGAARHKGFIPWDDDLDVGIPRKDYDKLIAISKMHQDGKYIFESVYSNNRDFCYPYIKVYDTSTTMVENKRQPLVRGTFIDVFPLDGIGNDYDNGMLHYKKIIKKYKFCLTLIAGIRKGRSFYKNLIVAIMRMVPRILLDDNKLMKEIDRLCAKYDFDESKYCGNLLGANGIVHSGSREIMDNKVFGVPTLYEFEKLKFYGVSEFDTYLTHIYGDWRQLPPIEKQITHHDFVSLDLCKSYLNN